MKGFRNLLVISMMGALLLAACGSPSKAPESTTKAEPAPTQQAQPEKTSMTARVGIGSTDSLIYLPMSLAGPLKYFEKEGIKVERPNFSGGAQIAQALVEGNLDFALFAYNHVIRYQIQGIPLTSVAMIAELPGAALVVDTRSKDTIKSIQDLKGMKVGVTSPGSGSHDMLLSMLTAAGLSAKDVEVVGVGFDLGKAFQQGKVSVGVTYEPYVSILLESGQGVLVKDPRTDLRTVAGVQALYGTDRYPMTTLVTSKSLIQKNPELVQRMVNVVLSTNAWIASHSPAEIAAQVPDSDKGDPKYYEAALRNAKNIISPTGAIGTKTVEAVVKDLKASKTVAESANIDIKAVIDDQFINKAVLIK